MTSLELLLGASLALWLLLTVINQVDSKRLRRLRQADVLGLLPMWWFFAPIPGRHDFHLLVRDRLVSGSVTPWKELQLNSTRRWWNFVWNPARRQRKAFIDLAIELTHTAGLARLPPAEVEFTETYLAFINLISRLPRTADSLETQFLIMMTAFDGESDRTPKAVFVSSFHALA